MNDHARGFIYDDQVVVLENDIKRNIFWTDVAFVCGFYRDGNFVIFVHRKPWVGYHFAIYRDLALVDQL